MFELNRQTIEYEFKLRGHPLVATIRWPSPDEFRSLYRDMRVEMKNVGDGVLELMSRDNPHLLPFLVDHFQDVRSANSRAISFSIEDLKTKMRENRNLDPSRALILESLLSADLVDDEPDPEADISLDEIARESVRIEIHHREDGETRRSILEHKLQPPTTAQRRAWNQAFRHKRKRNRIFQEADVHQITKLYEQRVVEIDGASWDGQPCTAENRDAWLSHVPYPWIDTVMTADARGAEAVGFT